MKKLVLTVVMLLSSHVAMAKDTLSIIWPFGPVAATLPVRSMIDNHNRTGQSPTLILEFKQGAGGVVATQHVLSSSEPIIYYASAGFFLYNAFAEKQAYDVNKFTTLKHLCDLPVTVASKKFSSMRAIPSDRPVTVATTGTGNGFHLVFKALQRQYPNMIEIAYKSSADGIKDLLGDHVDMIIATPGDTFPLEDNKLAKNIGVTGSSRVRSIPTLTESLIPNTQRLTIGYYFFLDQRFADRAESYRKILDTSVDNNTKEIMAKNHCVPATTSAAQLPGFIQNAQTFWNQQAAAVRTK